MVVDGVVHFVEVEATAKVEAEALRTHTEQFRVQHANSNKRLCHVRDRDGASVTDSSSISAPTRIVHESIVAQAVARQTAPLTTAVVWKTVLSEKFFQFMLCLSRRPWSLDVWLHLLPQRLIRLFWLLALILRSLAKEGLVRPHRSTLLLRPSRFTHRGLTSARLAVSRWYQALHGRVGRRRLPPCWSGPRRRLSCRSVALHSHLELRKVFCSRSGREGDAMAMEIRRPPLLLALGCRASGATVRLFQQVRLV